jgi:hypothetical protein
MHFLVSIFRVYRRIQSTLNLIMNSGLSGAEIGSLGRIKENNMKRQTANQPVNDSPGLRFDDRTRDVDGWTLREAGSWLYGILVSMDVTSTPLAFGARSSNFMPEGMRFEDDPAAEFEESESSGGVFFGPDRGVIFHA